MAQNIVIPNKDNKVVLEFGGLDLTLATDIVVDFGAETYSLVTTPNSVVVESATELSLDLSSTSETGKIFATVTYFDGGSTNGTDITSRELNNLGQIVVAIGSQLTVEDGTIVAGANSFVNDDEFKAFARLNGYSVPATQPDREALLSKAFMYLNSTYEQRLQGYRLSSVQSGMFPRSDVYAYDFLVDSSTIPEDIKAAQMSAALSINDGADTNAIKTDADLASFEVVGVYKESYQAGANTPTLPEMPAVSRYLRPYTKGGGGMSLNRENFGYLY